MEIIYIMLQCLMTVSLCGYLHDQEVELYYLNARYYAPGLGRFLTKDSLINLKNIKSINLYVYVQDDPVNMSDPTGNIATHPVIIADGRGSGPKPPENDENYDLKALAAITCAVIITTVSYNISAIVDVASEKISQNILELFSMGTSKVSNFAGEIGANNIPNMTKEEILEGLPEN